jgi:hypothetical protein
MTVTDSKNNVFTLTCDTSTRGDLFIAQTRDMHGILAIVELKPVPEEPGSFVAGPVLYQRPVPWYVWFVPYTLRVRWGWEARWPTR